MVEGNKSFVPPELQRPDCLDVKPEPVQNVTREMQREGDKQKDFTRTYPWFIDIFLFPVNITGLSMILIIAGIPFLIMCISFLFYFLPVIGLFVSLIGALITIVINVYAYFCLCVCMKSSAEGFVRVSSNISENSDLTDSFFQLLRAVICIILFFGPAFIYLITVEKKNNTFYYLLAAGIAFYPISLLSVVLNDSLSGLNPFLLLIAIFKTFFYYIVLILILWAGVFVVLYVHYYIVKHLSGAYGASISLALILGVFRFVKIYLLMISVHLLGRFYYKNSHKLKWAV